MPRSVFERMHNRLFARLGEQAVFRSAPCTVVVEQGVAVSYETGDDKYVQSEMAASVDLVNLPSDLKPTPGERITLPGGKVRIIDAIASDNGYVARCVLR